jgi:predicted phosphodiesterase
VTRLAILSDIHGNLPALETVIDDMQQFSPDHVIVAGDLINTVPFDAEVMDCVVSQGWTTIRGNHEFYLLDHGTPRERENMLRSKSPPWLNKNLKKWIPYIAAMPDQLTLYYQDGPPVHVTHGLPGNPFDAVTRVTPEAQVIEWLKDVKETTYIAGHYHLSVERRIGRWYILNPGPVGAMCDGTHTASYMLLDSAGDHWEATFRQIPYDYSRVEAEFQKQNLREILGVEGLLKCEQVRRARPTINAFYRWMCDNHPDEEWSYDLAYEFLALPLEAVWDSLGSGYLVNPDIPLPPPPKNGHK